MSATTDFGFRFGSAEVRPGERTLLVDGTPARLGARAFDVLLALIERHDRVVPKDELLELVWPGLVVEENNLQVQVSALRKLLGSQVITTVPGRGYRFTAALDESPSGAPRPAARAVAGNLPPQRTRFIGREAALAECARLLEQTRLLTLTGIGGCGKTRMALQLAQQRAAEFSDGVWFVDLAPLQDAGRVVATVASTVRVREEADAQLIDRLAEALAARQSLVVLDNCEHVIDAVVELADVLLAACPALKIVATSREALGITGEQIYPVRSLSVPAATDVESVQAAESVRVFADRARLVVPEFEVNAANAAAIADICRRLDGIALAIELAAARVKVLSVDEIRARLDDRFRLLTGGNRALPRHQTLQAAMQWSYEQLASAEQRVMRVMSVFAGGWTLAAAVDVAQAGDEYEILSLLTTLHDKSLLAVDRDAGRPRYRMLETVRQYALERLQESGDADPARTRHLQHFVDFAEQASSDLHGLHESEWMRRLQAEQQNLLAAEAWCSHAADGSELRLRLAGATWQYWVATAQIELGYCLARAAHDGAADGADSLPRWKALYAVGRLALFTGRYDVALDFSERGLAMARRLDLAPQVMSALALTATCLNAKGNSAAALERLEEGLTIARQPGNAYWLGSVLNPLAEVHRALGNLDIAERHYREAIDIARRESSMRGRAVCLANLTRLLIARDDLAQARECIVECLAIADSAGLNMACDLLDVGIGLASKLGDHRAAAIFFGADMTHLEESGTEREPLDEAFVAASIARSREALGMAEFDAACAVGRSMDFEQSMSELTRWVAATRITD